MSNKRLRISLIAITIILVLSTAACTRSASTPPPSPEEGEAPSAQSDTQATMDAIRSAILTQTAQASEGEESPSSTPTAEEPTDTATATPEESESPVATTPTATPIPGGQVEYTVKPGDWIWKIARDYNVDPQEIIDLNGLSDPGDISVGMTLLIPLSETTVEPTAVVSTPVTGGITHIVQSGEWIWEIARTYGVDPQAIIDANDLADPANIYPGQELIIP